MNVRNRKMMASLALAVAALSLSSCANENAQDVLSQVKSLEYTGNTTTDLKNLCNLGNSVNKLNNDQKEVVNGTLVRVTDKYSSQSSSQEVKQAAKLLKMSVSTDAEVREQGEQGLTKACNAI